MRVLITGADGFVGHWAVEVLTRAGHEVIPTEPSPRRPGTLPLDVTDRPAMETLIGEKMPDACLHLGGIAFVPMGWKNPVRLYEINTLGTLNVLEAFRHQNPKAAILMVSSAEVYGREAREHSVDEEAALRPSNLYGVSKLAADESCLLYARHYGMRIMTARPANHIGPGQSEHFVATAFARQLIALKKQGGAGILQVGNLEAQRDFLDVRDVVEAYRLLLEQGQGGQAYNLASGQLTRIQEMLDTLCDILDCHPDILVDPELYRPADQPVVLDSTRIRQETGWTPTYELRQTLSDLVDSLR